MIRPKKLLTLDVLRGVACLLVWISHVRVATRYFKDARFDFIQTFTAWGRESVVIFFILSGVVINLSSQNKTSRPEYFKKRFIRIYPIYLAVLIICFLSDHYILGHNIDNKTLLGNLLLSGTLRAYLFSTMPLNPVVWSITCEAFFYLVFGLIYTSKRPTAIWIWFGISFISIIYRAMENEYNTGLFYHIVYLLNCSFLWILGYLVYEYHYKINVALPVALCSALMIPMVTRLHQLAPNLYDLTYLLAGIYLLLLFFWMLKNHETQQAYSKLTIKIVYLLPVYLINLWLLWHYSNSLITNKIFYSVLPVLALAIYLKPVAVVTNFIYNKLKGILLFIADISYPVYLLHTPVMYLIFYFMPAQKIAGMLLAVIITLLLSYTFELYLFRKLFLTNKQTDTSFVKEHVL